MVVCLCRACVSTSQLRVVDTGPGMRRFELARTEGTRGRREDARRAEEERAGVPRATGRRASAGAGASADSRRLLHRGGGSACFLYLLLISYF